MIYLISVFANDKLAKQNMNIAQMEYYIKNKLHQQTYGQLTLQDQI